MKDKKKDIEKATLDVMVKNGTINILALGYKGVEAWREKRSPLKKIKNEKKD